MKMVEALKKKNRTLLEMHLGILVLGIVCQVVGAFLVKNQLFYAISLWSGIALAMVSSFHMYRTLDRALDFDEKTASQIIFRGYLIRYVSLVLFLLIIIKTELMNPLIVFMGYMSLKVTALLQPITHKLCNRFFHETDPETEPVSEEVLGGEGELSAENLTKEVKI